MKMYYCTRYLHNPNKETLFYVGGGRWEPVRNNRISPRLYTKEELAKCVIQDLTETDWFCVNINI